jgi:hypothetical protein
MMAGDRTIVSTLIELGATVSQFALRETEHEAIVDSLVRSAAFARNMLDEDPVDVKLVRAFDKQLRNKGLAEPFKNQLARSIAPFATVSTGTLPKIVSPL